MRVFTAPPVGHPTPLHHTQRSPAGLWCCSRTTINARSVEACYMARVATPQPSSQSTSQPSQLSQLKSQPVDHQLTHSQRQQLLAGMHQQAAQSSKRKEDLVTGRLRPTCSPRIASSGTNGRPQHSMTHEPSLLPPQPPASARSGRLPWPHFLAASEEHTHGGPVQCTCSQRAGG